MIEAVSWILTIIAIYGTYLNANGNIRGFYYWLVSNTGFCLINFLLGSMAQSLLFGVYLVLAIIGLQKWNEKNQGT